MRSIKQKIDKRYSEGTEKELRFIRQRYRASRKLAWRLRKQQTENTIHRIRDPLTNKTTAKLKETEKVFETYYISLYTQTEVYDRQIIQKFLESLDISSIWKYQNEKLVSEISAEEINRAISGLSASRSPGCNGFSPKWYKSMRQPMFPLLDAILITLWREE